MSRPRLSIAGMMALVLACGLGVGALRSPTPLWAGTIYTLTLATLGLGVLGSLYRRGTRRAFWVGFVTFGWGYWILALSPWVGEQVEPRLITRSILDALYAMATPGAVREADEEELRTGFEETPVGRDLAANLRANEQRLGAKLLLIGDARDPELEQLQGYNAELRELYEAHIRAIRGRSFLASNPSNTSTIPFFSRIGQCLFALLAGLMGGLIAARFLRTRDDPSGPDDAPPPPRPTP